MANDESVRIGLLFDFPQHDGGDSFEQAVELGLAEIAETGRLDRSVELVRELTDGHPTGSPDNVARGFRGLVEGGAALVIGPSISDNALAVRPVADELGVVSLNYTGGERTRGDFAFHYQVGSLEEEPPVLAQRLVARGLRRPAIVHDASVVGERYRECFGWAAGTLGLDIASSVAISPLAEDVSDVVRAMRAAEPDSLVYLGLGAASHAVAVALADEGWAVPVVANSALMFGYAKPDWRDAWRGWEYLDNIADDNAVRSELARRAPKIAAGPIGCAAYDMGRLVGEAIARADAVTPAGLSEGLERVKQLPAASGYDGTLMGFGVWDRAALKGTYLVLRAWREGKTVQVDASVNG